MSGRASTQPRAVAIAVTASAPLAGWAAAVAAAMLALLGALALG